jgi:N-acetylmuramoyl-L-alanine amidase
LDSESGQNEIATAIANAIISYKNEYYGTGVENLDVRPSQRNAETAAKTVQPLQKLIQNLLTLKKQLLNKILHKSFLKVQISASGRKWIWNLRISKD